MVSNGNSGRWMWTRAASKQKKIISSKSGRSFVQWTVRVDWWLAIFRFEQKHSKSESIPRHFIGLMRDLFVIMPLWIRAAWIGCHPSLPSLSLRLPLLDWKCKRYSSMHRLTGYACVLDGNHEWWMVCVVKSGSLCASISVVYRSNRTSLIAIDCFWFVCVESSAINLRIFFSIHCDLAHFGRSSYILLWLEFCCFFFFVFSHTPFTGSTF